MSGRVVNIGLLEDEHLAPGDWVLIHVGFAMSKIDEQEAQRALEGLQLLGRELDDELQALASSRITAEERSAGRPGCASSTSTAIRPRRGR